MRPRACRNGGTGPCRHGAGHPLRLADLDRAAAARHAARGVARIPAARDMSAGSRIRPMPTSVSNGRASALRLAKTMAHGAWTTRSALAARAATERGAAWAPRCRADPAALPAGRAGPHPPRSRLCGIRTTPRLPSTPCASCWRAIGGVAFLPDQAAAKALFDRLRAGPLCATLSRTVVDARRAGIFLRRESRGLPRRCRRRRLSSGTAAGGSHWATAFGRIVDRAARAAARRQSGQLPKTARRQALSAPRLLPSRRCGAAANALVLRGERRAGGSRASCPAVAPFARFLPSFDLAPAAPSPG